jgi:hypothetical protein
MIRFAGATGRKDKTSPGQHIAAEQEHGFLKHALILVLLGFPPVHGFPCQLISTTASINIKNIYNIYCSQKNLVLKYHWVMWYAFFQIS